MKTFKEIQYKHTNIGYFPTLDRYFKHGFSWGKNSGNFSFSLGDRQDVYQRNLEFFNKLKLESPRNAVLMIPEHKTNIVLIDQEILSQKGHFSGKNVNCDSIITLLPNVTLTVKVADCQTYYIYGENDKGEKLKGLVHSGWRGTNALFSKKVIGTIIEEYKIKTETINIGLVPGIFQKDRTIQDFSTIEGNLSHWGDRVYSENGDYYLDSRNFTIDQLKEMGVKDENIHVYDLNTFDCAKKGLCYSQKLEYLLEKDGDEVDKGRFIVAMRT